MVSNNLINFVDLLGLEKLSTWEKIYYTFVFWEKKPRSGGYAFEWDWADPDWQEFFKKRAGGDKNPNVGHGESGRELMEHMKKITGRYCCIKDYRIAGHGWAFRAGRRRGPGLPSEDNPEAGFLITQRGRTYSPDVRDIAELKSEIVKNNIKFCKKCTISVYACRISNSFIQALSTATGCTVTAAGGACYPAEGLNAPTDGDWKTGRKNLSEPPGESQNFYQSTNGSDPEAIGDTFTPPTVK